MGTTHWVVPRFHFLKHFLQHCHLHAKLHGVSECMLTYVLISFQMPIISHIKAFKNSIAVLGLYFEPESRFKSFSELLNLQKIRLFKVAIPFLKN